MKKLQILLIIITSMIMTSFSSSTQTSNGTITQVIDYSGATIQNMCTGEAVTFSGSMLLVISSNSNGSNISSQIVAKPDHLSFVSNTGESFSAIGVTIQRTKASKVDGQLVISANNNMLFIGDRGTKYMLNESGRIVINGDGSLGSYNYDRNLRCN
jgi:hypothetical protein